MAQDTQRRYALTRVRAGDYIVPSNDGTQLWRISSYDETGLGERLDSNGKWHPITGTFWQTAKFELTVEQMHARWGDDLPDDFLDWDRWQFWAGGYRSRRDALADALR